MLAANKDQLLADVRHRALGIRQRELDSLSQRYGSLVAVASICAGFAFSGLVEFDFPETELDNEDGLLKFMETKAQDGTTLLHYLSSTIMNKSPELSNFSTELHRCPRPTHRLTGPQRARGGQRGAR